MQQRPTSHSRAPVGQSPPRKANDFYDLPIYDPLSNVGRRENSGWSRGHDKCVIHGIPLLVLLSLFLLWWFSYPVDLVIKNGRIEGIHRLQMPRPLDGARVDITILAAAISPIAYVPQNLNEIESQMVYTTE